MIQEDLNESHLSRQTPELGVRSTHLVGEEICVTVIGSPTTVFALDEVVNHGNLRLRMLHHHLRLEGMELWYFRIMIYFRPTSASEDDISSMNDH